MGLILHADDFGITLEQSKRILACCEAAGGAGSLNSLSVMVNSPNVAECCKLLEPYRRKVRIGLHFNLVEGRCCADPREIPLLVDESGVFSQSFIGLTALSFGPHRDEFRLQVLKEALAQLDRFLALFPDLRGRLRVDSHQHTHMIPAVLDALFEAIGKRGCILEYMRISSEPAAPFLRNPRCLVLVPPINWAKHCVLNFLWRFRKKRYAQSLNDGKSSVFCGLAFSGCMDERHVSVVFPALRAYADEKGRSLELLFHPGGCDSRDDALNPMIASFPDFYLSENRAAEAKLLVSGYFQQEAIAPCIEKERQR